jgi:hypothetical protein
MVCGGDSGALVNMPISSTNAWVTGVLSAGDGPQLAAPLDDCNQSGPAGNAYVYVSSFWKINNYAQRFRTQQAPYNHPVGPNLLKPGISLLFIVLVISPSQAKSSPSRRLVGVWQVAEVNGEANEIAGTVEFRSERPMVLTWDGCNRGEALTYSVIGSVLRVTNSGGIEGVRKTMRYCKTPKTPGLVEILRRKPRVTFLKDGGLKLSSSSDPALTVVLR